MRLLEVLDELANAIPVGKCSVDALDAQRFQGIGNMEAGKDEG